MRILLVLLFCSCSSFPPLTVGAGFMGATVQVSTPGWSAPVPVKSSISIDKPVLLVPENTVDVPTQATVQGDGDRPTSTVPVLKASVTAPVLIVPSVKLNSTES